jgi:hypothetical protein
LFKNKIFDRGSKFFHRKRKVHANGTGFAEWWMSRFAFLTKGPWHPRTCWLSGIAFYVSFYKNLKTMNQGNAGVWMDHLTAKIIEADRHPQMACVIRSISEGRRVRIPGEETSGVRLGNRRSSNDEYHRHNSAREELHMFFKDLERVLRPYSTILLFGPTTAHDEFHNFLLQDKNRVMGKRIFTRRSNYMTDRQLEEYVRDFYYPLWRIKRRPVAYRR